MLSQGRRAQEDTQTSRSNTLILEMETERDGACQRWHCKGETESLRFKYFCRGQGLPLPGLRCPEYFCEIFPSCPLWTLGPRNGQDNQESSSAPMGAHLFSASVPPKLELLDPGWARPFHGTKQVSTRQGLLVVSGPEHFPAG